MPMYLPWGCLSTSLVHLFCTRRDDQTRSSTPWSSTWPSRRIFATRRSVQARPFFDVGRFGFPAIRRVEADWSGARSNTTKSATSQVKGGFWRRSVFRWSVSSTGWEDARRSPCRRSHETTTGSSAVFRVSPSNRRCAPRRTTIPTGFRDDGLRDRCFSTVFVGLRGTADLSAAIACYFAARRIATQSHVHSGTGILG